MFPLLITVLACLLSVTSSAHAQTGRDQWQKVDEIFAALQLVPGDTIADIGAGDGFFSIRLSPLLGPSGRVLAVDIDERALRQLERSAERQSLANIEIVVSEPDDPRLAANSLDGALIIISYHEFGQHEAMLAGIKSALRPGARLVIVDNAARDPTAPRQTQMQRHHMDIGVVGSDLIRAGFDIIERRPDFIQPAGSNRRHHWMLVAQVR
jgi:precorrin-6B methylase 2